MPEGTSEAVAAQASAEAQNSEQISQEAEAQQEQQEESSPLTPEQVAAIKQIAGQTALEGTTPVIQSQVAKGENRVFKRIQAQFDALELNRQALGLSDEQVKEARQHIVAEAFAAPEDDGQAATKSLSSKCLDQRSTRLYGLRCRSSRKPACDWMLEILSLKHSNPSSTTLRPPRRPWPSTWIIIDSVLAGEVGSMIWISPDSKLVVYSRPLFDGVAWVCARAKADMSYAGGNLANYETWQQLKDWMTAQGWQVINASLASARFAVESLRLIEMSLTALTIIPVACAYPELFYLTGSCDAPADET